MQDPHGHCGLSSNEIPLSSPAALKAVTDAFVLVWRYPDEHEQVLVEGLAKLHGVSSNQILLANGSGEFLRVVAAAFTSPAKKLVVADPTFEAISRHARAAQAEVLRTSLTKDYAHDLPRMLAAGSGGGLIYICNPNNPTASLTSKDSIATFLARVRATLYFDEAYHHYWNQPTTLCGTVIKQPKPGRVRRSPRSMAWPAAATRHPIELFNGCVRIRPTA